MKTPHTLAVIAYCALLFWMSSGPIPAAAPIAFDGLDKLLHAAAYGLLAAMVFHGMLRSGRPWPPRALFWVPVLFTALYGASDEFHQYFVPTRSCDALDWLADLTGALATTAALLALSRRLVPEPFGRSGE